MNLEETDIELSDPAQILHELVQSLISPELNFEDEEEIIDRIHELFSEVSLVSGFDEIGEYIFI